MEEFSWNANASRKPKLKVKEGELCNKKEPENGNKEPKKRKANQFQQEVQGVVEKNNFLINDFYEMIYLHVVFAYN